MVNIRANCTPEDIYVTLMAVQNNLEDTYPSQKHALGDEP